MVKILIVYYSRTGHTQQVAKSIAKELDADLEAIVDVKNREGVLNYLFSAWESFREKPTFIQTPINNPADYDLVVLGSPTWVGSMSSPMRAYINIQQKEFKEIALFCTSISPDNENMLQDMASLCEQESIASLIVTEEEIKNRAYCGNLEKFTAALKAHLKKSGL